MKAKKSGKSAKKATKVGGNKLTRPQLTRPAELTRPQLTRPSAMDDGN